MTSLNRAFTNQEEITFLLNSADSNSKLELIDRSLRGLVLLKRKNGSPKWVLKYQCPRTLQKRALPLGSYAEMSVHEARQLGMEAIRLEYGADQFELSISSMQNAVEDLKIDNIVSASIDNLKAPFAFDDYKKPNDLDDLDPKSDALVSNSNKSLLLDKVRAFINLKEFVTGHYIPYIKVAKRSWATDVSVLNNHILPFLGGYVMIDIKPFLVQEMVQNLVEKGLSPSTCNRGLIILRFMFNCALRWEVLPKIENPCKNIKELPLNNKKERFLNGGEVTQLKTQLLKSKNKFLPYIIQLLILTGCRRGEALKAKVQHFDLVRGDWVVPLPKAGKARHIPLSTLAIQTIRASLEMKQGYNQVTRESHYLFPNPSTGEPFQQIFYSWDKARKASHIDSVRMHDLRHSFASAMVNSGMTLYDVKQILGHSNIRTTERYAHLSNSRLRQAADSVGDFYNNQNWIGDKKEEPIEGAEFEEDDGNL